MGKVGGALRSNTWCPQSKAAEQTPGENVQGGKHMVGQNTRIMNCRHNRDAEGKEGDAGGALHSCTCQDRKSAAWSPILVWLVANGFVVKVGGFPAIGNN